MNLTDALLETLEILVECRTKYLAEKVCPRVTNIKICRMCLICCWKENTRGKKIKLKLKRKFKKRKFWKFILKHFSYVFFNFFSNLIQKILLFVFFYYVIFFQVNIITISLCLFSERKIRCKIWEIKIGERLNISKIVTKGIKSEISQRAKTCITIYLFFKFFSFDR